MASNKQGKGADKIAGAKARRERAAEQLRRNLQRRKAQSRSRADTEAGEKAAGNAGETDGTS